MSKTTDWRTLRVDNETLYWEVFTKERTVYAFAGFVVVKAADDATEVTVGDTLQFSVASGQAVTWSIVEEVVDGTSISTAGLLTVAEAETATELTVKATAAGKSGALKVTVATA